MYASVPQTQVKVFERLGFRLVREGNHMAMVRVHPDGTRTPLTMPNHRRIKGSTLRTILTGRGYPETPFWPPMSRSEGQSFVQAQSLLRLNSTARFAQPTSPRRCGFRRQVSAGVRLQCKHGSTSRRYRSLYAGTGAMPWRCHLVMRTRVLLGLARTLRFALASVLSAALLPCAHQRIRWCACPGVLGMPNAFRWVLSKSVEHRRRKACFQSRRIALPAQGLSPLSSCSTGAGGSHMRPVGRSGSAPGPTSSALHGIGTAVVDSFGPRGVDHVCTGNVAAWAVRRADDAYSTRAWLVEQPDVDVKHIAVMGMSNGGRTVRPRCAPRCGTPSSLSQVWRCTPDARRTSAVPSMRRCPCLSARPTP